VGEGNLQQPGMDGGRQRGSVRSQPCRGGGGSSSSNSSSRRRRGGKKPKSSVQGSRALSAWASCELANGMVGAGRAWVLSTPAAWPEPRPKHSRPRNHTAKNTIVQHRGGWLWGKATPHATPTFSTFCCCCIPPSLLLPFCSHAALCHCRRVAPCPASRPAAEMLEKRRLVHLDIWVPAVLLCCRPWLHGHFSQPTTPNTRQTNSVLPHSLPFAPSPPLLPRQTFGWPRWPAQRHVWLVWAARAPTRFVAPETQTTPPARRFPVPAADWPRFSETCQRINPLNPLLPP